MFDLFLNKIKFITKSPMALFIYGIMSKWYIMMAVSSIIVAYWVLQGLTEAGILQASEKVVSQALNETKSVARYCVPKILSPANFWSCLQNPPEYNPTPEDGQIENLVKEINEFGNYNQNKDPYSE